MVKKFLIILLVLILVGSGIFGYSLNRGIREVDKKTGDLLNDLKHILDLASESNYMETIKAVYQIKLKVKDSIKVMEKNPLLLSFPLTSKKYNNTLYTLKFSKTLLDSGDELLNELYPVAKVVQEGKPNNQVDGLLGIINQYPIYKKKLVNFLVVLPELKKYIAQIDPEPFPEKYRGVSIEEIVYRLKDMALRDDFNASSVSGFFESLYQILGSGNKSEYLVLFQNNAEIRATGGFITAYGVLNVDQGKLNITKSEDIYKLDERVLTDIPAPPVIRQLEVAYLNSRDSNLSPDFPTSAQEFLKYYRKDGNTDPLMVIGLDTDVFIDLIKVVGPIKLSKYNDVFDASISENGISQALLKLEDYTQKPKTNAETRKDIIGDLMKEIISRFYSVSPDNIPILFNTFTKLINQKHILAYSTDKQINDFLNGVGVSGKIVDTDSIYLHINHSNFGGKKSNLYIDETVEVNFEIDKANNIFQEVTTILKSNNAQETILNSLYYDWVRVYTPTGSKYLGSGSTERLKQYQELGKQVFENSFYVKPGGTGDFYLKYQLPIKYQKNKPLKLFVQKQPGTKTSRYVIKINGKSWKEFDIDKDTTIPLE